MATKHDAAALELAQALHDERTAKQAISAARVAYDIARRKSDRLTRKVVRLFSRKQ